MITVQSILDVQGTKASVVNLMQAVAGNHHSGLSIPTGGELKMAYAVQVGGGIDVSGGKITLVGAVVQTALLLAVFVPFSYFMDRVVWRQQQKRLSRGS